MKEEKGEEKRKRSRNLVIPSAKGKTLLILLDILLAGPVRGGAREILNNPLDLVISLDEKLQPLPGLLLNLNWGANNITGHILMHIDLSKNRKKEERKKIMNNPIGTRGPCGTWN